MKDIVLEKYEEMLNEDWFTSIKRDGVLVDIFKNPSSKEWKDIIEDARGLITDDGDLYIANYECVHNELIGILYDKKVLSSDTDSSFIQNDFLIIQRDRNTKNIYIGESIDSEDIDYNEETQNFISKIYKLTKNKNPFLNFYPYSILEMDDDDFIEDRELI